MSNDQKSSKVKEWFAVKRTKDSKSYQFYEPNKYNRETIAAIAPDGGNFEEIELVEKSIFNEIVAQNDILKKQIKKLTKIELPSLSENMTVQVKRLQSKDSYKLPFVQNELERVKEERDLLIKEITQAKSVMEDLSLYNKQLEKELTEIKIVNQALEQQRDAQMSSAERNQILAKNARLRQSIEDVLAETWILTAEDRNRWQNLLRQALVTNKE